VVRLNRDDLLKHREVLSVEDWAEIRRLAVVTMSVVDTAWRLDQ